jgi:hypothetical protein
MNLAVTISRWWFGQKAANFQMGAASEQEIVGLRHARAQDLVHFVIHARRGPWRLDHSIQRDGQPSNSLSHRDLLRSELERVPAVGATSCNPRRCCRPTHAYRAAR